MYLMQDSLIFFRKPVHEAQRASIARRFPAVESVFIQADVRLHAWHIGRSPLVLHFGGNAEEVSWMLEEAPRRAPGVGWLPIDYRGEGPDHSRRALAPAVCGLGGTKAVGRTAGRRAQ